MRAGRIVERVSALGAAAQASVPGAYAWGVTVAPAAWARGASAVSRGAAVAALLSLGLVFVDPRRLGGRARVVSLWGFVLSSALAWSSAPSALAPLRVDAPRGLAGMLGWALFALASAAPALQGAREPGRVTKDDGLVPRRRLARGDALYVACGVVLAAALQAVGWGAATPERALLVRLVAVAAGLAVLGGATQAALARHVQRAPVAGRRRLQRAMLALLVLALLGLVGLVVVVQV